MHTVQCTFVWKTIYYFVPYWNQTGLLYVTVHIRIRYYLYGSGYGYRSYSIFLQCGTIHEIALIWFARRFESESVSEIRIWWFYDFSVCHWLSAPNWVGSSSPDQCNFDTDPDIWIRTLDYESGYGAGSRSCSLRQWLSRCQQNIRLFLLISFWRYDNISGMIFFLSTGT